MKSATTLINICGTVIIVAMIGAAVGIVLIESDATYKRECLAAGKICDPAVACAQAGGTWIGSRNICVGKDHTFEQKGLFAK